MGVGVIAVVVLVALVGAAGWMTLKNNKSKRSMNPSEGTRKPNGGRRARSSATGGAEGRNGAVEARSHWLIGESPQVAGKTYHVGFRCVTAGRLPSNFIQLPGDLASRNHFQLTGKPEGLEVLDMSSSNGTYVNGEKLKSAQVRVLEDGDRIKVGDAEYRYEATGDYETDSALAEQKAAGPQQNAATAGVESGNVEEMLEDALRRTGGDVERTAEIMGVEPELVRQMKED